MTVLGCMDELFYIVLGLIVGKIKIKASRKVPEALILLKPTAGLEPATC